MPEHRLIRQERPVAQTRGNGTTSQPDDALTLHRASSRLRHLQVRQPDARHPVPPAAIVALFR